MLLRLLLARYGFSAVACCLLASASALSRKARYGFSAYTCCEDRLVRGPVGQRKGEVQIPGDGAV